MGYDNDLIRFYDQDAEGRDQAELSPARVAWRQRFIDLMRDEGRTLVIELGCGPGHDGRGFADADMAWTGVDLSIEHAKRATDHGVTALVGSLFDPPLRVGTFEAGWSMSTLVHVADSDFDRALAAITAVLAPGAPLALGLWGGNDTEERRDEDLFDPPRFYSLRNHERIQTMLAEHGRLEHFETYDPGVRGGWEYQFAIIRTPT